MAGGPEQVNPAAADAPERSQMSTIVYLHAHPDDESTLTGGTMALAHRRGHRVVWICCTDGSLGTASEHEPVAVMRRREAEGSARVLGVDRLIFLGHSDSGMTGWESNAAPESFMNADVAAVAREVADILDEEDADFLVGYDWHGNYGHPDHIMVHRVTHPAAELAARRPRVLEATMNRDASRRQFEQLLATMRESGDGQDLPPGEIDFNPDAPADDGNPIGTPEAELSWAVDVTEVVQVKRQALVQHSSQSDAAQMLSMPENWFAAAFGWEYYIEQGVTPMRVGWPFGDVLEGRSVSGDEPPA